MAVGLGGNVNAVKTTTDTVVLNGNNTYTNGTRIDAGGLLVNGALAGSVTVNSTGVLGGGGTLSGSVTVNSGGTVAPGAAGSPATLRVNSMTLTSGSHLHLLLDGAAGNDRLSITGSGTLDVSNAYLDDFLLAGWAKPAVHAFSIVDLPDGMTLTGNFVNAPDGSVVFTENGTPWHLLRPRGQRSGPNAARLGG